jgi:GH25 family lysozyme M1 (1,4-beta-N-acetylmuramidase)
VLRRAIVLAGTALLVLTASAAPALARTRIRGVDVSHWQGTIDWKQVAGSGVRFVFAKATEGRTFDDPNYTTYKAGTAAAGISFTAYHFARPDETVDDAILEADHFTGVAQLASGNLIPALDLEDSGGLDTAALSAWTFDWLDEATATLGVKPMIYTSPSFWETYMGDSRAFADAGYRLLWIAEWDVPNPHPPGSNWGGFGWTFWQRTDCQTVPGIVGCVDGDVYNGFNLDRVRIP